MTKWSEEELAILANALALPKKERPSYKVIARDLPGRTVHAIKAQRMNLIQERTEEKSAAWTSQERAVLVENLPPKEIDRATAEELRALLPGRTYYAISTRIGLLDLPRPRPKKKKKKHPTWPIDMPHFQDDPRACKPDYRPMPSKRDGYIVRGDVR